VSTHLIIHVILFFILDDFSHGFLLYNILIKGNIFVFVDVGPQGREVSLVRDILELLRVLVES
jgi:hypothetical protein